MARFTLPNPPDISGMTPETAIDVLSGWVREANRVIDEGLQTLDAEARKKGVPVDLPRATVSDLTGSSPRLRPTPAGRWVYCTDETGGEVPAFSDGSDWRRCTDRAVVS